jgi:ribosomal protein L11 methyltransferase
VRYLALHFETTHEASELLADFLSELGAAGIQTEDAADVRSILADPSASAYADESFLEGLDEIVRMTAYFQDHENGVLYRKETGLSITGLYGAPHHACMPLGQLEDLVRERLSGFAENLDVGRGYVGWEDVREEDWANNWKQYYQTLHLTRRLVVNPSWISYQPADGEIVITLDPGGAFGTGTHETTAMCAEFLDERLLPGARVLDLGTGSGILAIVAASLGAGRVEAIDIDPAAVEVAKANCRINQAQVDCHQGELPESRHAPFDLIVANIIADVICAIAPGIPGQLAEGGLFIASGIIEDKLGRVLDAARQAGLDCLECRERGDWRAVVFRRD